jgi:hypothetical protein
MPSVIICIHGLGNKPPKDLLKKWWQESLLEGLHRIDAKIKLPKFEMVYWADILHTEPLNPQEKNPESPAFLDEKYMKSENIPSFESHEKRAAVLDFLGHQLQRIFLNDDYSLNYSSIADSILKKYFTDLDAYYDEAVIPGVTSNVKNAIRMRLIQVLLKYKKYDIMLVSHSMGTIVAFDVLKYLVPEIKIHTFITIGSPLGNPVVLSQIAKEKRQITNEPCQFITPENISHAWFNMSDILDKVAFKYKLNDVFKPNKHRVQPIDFLVTNDYQMNGEPNPHKSYGYLRTQQMSSVVKSFIAAEKITVFERIERWIIQFFK